MARRGGGAGGIAGGARMKRQRALVVALLVASSALTIAATRLQLTSWHLEKVPVHWDSAEQDDAARRLDAVLSANLKRLAPLRDSLRASLNNPASAHAIASLHVDRCEVSQEAFRLFSLWSQQNPQRVSWAPGLPRDWKFESHTRGHRVSGRLNAPVNGITYHDAWTYCASAGGRLPFAEEWMAIAGGAEQRLYPWGDNFAGTAWPYLRPRLNAAQRCAAHPATDTDAGVHDLANNVAEWSQGLRSLPGPQRRPLLHGGDGRRKPHAVAALNALYQAASPAHRSPYAGFRCVYTAPRRHTPWRTRLALAELPNGVYPVGMPAQSRLAAAAAALSGRQLQQLAELIQKQDVQRGAFRVSRCEITRRHYGFFLLDPLVHLGLYADNEEPKNQSYTPLDWAAQRRRPELPVSGVDWWSARAFARWAGGRLPGAAEWVAMLGGASYPWGKLARSDAAITGDIAQAVPQACGGGALDESAPGGIRDLAGNVSEWTSSIVPRHRSYAPVIKGGSYLLPMDPASRADTQRAAPPGYRSPGVGLRVVFD